MAPEGQADRMIGESAAGRPFSGSVGAGAFSVCGNQNTLRPLSLDPGGEILDCELASLINLNSQAVAAGSVGEVAVVVRTAL